MTPRTFRCSWLRPIALASLLVLACLSAPDAIAAPSPKKGFDVVVRPDDGWRHDVVALHAQWFYNWGGDEPKNLPKGVEFVPMT